MAKSIIGARLRSGRQPQNSSSQLERHSPRPGKDVQILLSLALFDAIHISMDSKPLQHLHWRSRGWSRILRSPIHCTTIGQPRPTRLTHASQNSLPGWCFRSHAFLGRHSLCYVCSAGNLFFPSNPQHSFRHLLQLDRLFLLYGYGRRPGLHPQIVVA